MPALPGDVVALVMLLDAKGSQLVIDIAEHFAMSASTASELVTRAEGHGLVVKARNPANARTVIVDLSPAAQQRLTR